MCFCSKCIVHTNMSQLKVTTNFLICILETLSILSPDHSPVSTDSLLRTQTQMLLVQSVRHKTAQKKIWRAHLWNTCARTGPYLRPNMNSSLYYQDSYGSHGVRRGSWTPLVVPQDRSMGEGNLVSQSWARRLPFSSSIAPSGWQTIQDTPGRGM